MKGLAQERTSLSWSRTALSVIAVAALLARDPLGHAALVGCAVVVAVTAGVVARLRVRALARNADQPDTGAVTVPTAQREIVVLGTAVGLLAAAVGIAVVRAAG